MDHGLSERECEVLRLVSLGCSSGQVAKILGLTSSTIDNHRSRIMAKFGTNRSVLLTRLALKHKITTMNDKLTPAEQKKCGRKKDGWNL